MAAIAMLAAACGGDDDDSGAAGTGGSTAPQGPTITIRGQDFSESATIAQVYGQYLKAKGYDVKILEPAGFRTEALDGLKNGDFNMTVDYIGGDQTALAPDEKTTADPAATADIVRPLLAKQGSTLLDYSPATDGDALVVRGDFPGTKISDLKGANAKFGASSQCFERPQCYIGLTDPKVYGITFGGKKTIEFGPLLGEALKAKAVDAVIWNTTAPQIKADNFKVLEDDKGLFPAQNIAPIVKTDALTAYGDQLKTDLNDLSAKITTDDLLAWNTSTDIDKQESDQVASDWLSEKGLN
jgi:osmoprotectant transport system substrate-binding protein